MEIIIEKFRLVSNEERFNIFEKKMVETKDFETKQKTGEIREKEIEVAYDMKFENALKFIIDRMVNDQPLILSVKEYVELYSKERDKILNILK